jgi:hypothetical protein
MEMLRGQIGEGRSGAIKVRNHGPELFYPPGRMAWDGIVVLMLDALQQASCQPRINSVPLSSAGEPIKDLPLLPSGTVPQTCE